MVSETNGIGLRTAPTPFWLEPRVIWEAVSSFLSPTTYGLGIPKGAQQPVLLIPGFLADDVTMQPLWWKLSFHGYRPFFSELGRNDKCLDDQINRLILRLQEIRAMRGHGDKKIDIIGHSLGGLLAGVLKALQPQLVGKVATLGTPQSMDSRVHPFTAQLAAAKGRELQAKNGRVKCFTAECDCVFAQIARDGIDPDVCIYSSVDGVAEGTGTMHLTDATRNRQVVGATHIGMGLHPEAYRHVVLALNGY